MKRNVTLYLDIDAIKRLKANGENISELTNDFLIRYASRLDRRSAKAIARDKHKEWLQQHLAYYARRIKDPKDRWHADAEGRMAWIAESAKDLGMSLRSFRRRLNQYLKAKGIDARV